MSSLAINPDTKTAFAGNWPDKLHDLLKSFDVKQVAFVPDAGHAALIRQCVADKSMRAVRLTTEEEGIAQLMGAWLGGERGVLLMQSSGVGNCINMLSLSSVCHIPLLMIVTMRGDFGEFNPWQVPMGQGTRGALEAVGVIVQRADTAEGVLDTVTSGAKLAFNSSRPVAVLIGQNVLGAKDFKELTKG
jgi:sulfopyruvate decarboxylase alpha subunit